jgi:hypothetical protein
MLEDLFGFAGGYIVAVFVRWFSLAFLLTGLNDVSEHFWGRSWGWLRKHRLPVIVALVFLAQAVAYWDADRTHRAGAFDRGAFDKANLRTRISAL